MKNIKKILVPIDGSDHSAAALERGLQLSRQLEAKLHLLHVKDDRNPAASMYLGDALEAATERYDKEILEKALASIPERTAVTALLKTGDPADEILSYCQGEKIDLIVMGTRGLGAIQGRIFGSVSQQILNEAKCDVLIKK